MEQETIEEAAERFYPISKGGSMWMPSAHDCNQANKQEGFIAGAKWQAERMCEIMNAYADDVMGGCNLRAKEWFEQFKKK
jgi:hypothetical protein